jgi:tetratricopeptide (TPR) repeat protein
MFVWLVTIGFAEAADAAVELGELSVETSPADAISAASSALSAGRFAESGALYRALAEAGGGWQARLAEGVSWYELGSVHEARKAAEEAVRLAPDEPAAQNLLGLLYCESGDVARGIEVLKRAGALAKKQGRKATEARVLVNLSLARVDQGDAAGAAADADSAIALATEAGETDLLATAKGAKAAVEALAGTGSSVGHLLGKGQSSAARTRAEAAVKAAVSPRQQIAGALDLAAVERAEGNLDGAASRLAEASRKAREAGLVREAAVALVDLGLVQALGGRGGVATDTLRAAARNAGGGGYLVVEVDARCELGMVLAQNGDIDGAAGEQRAAGRLLAAMQYPQGVARQAELGGVIAAHKGDLATARSALTQAAGYYSGKGRNLDAARAATTLASAVQQASPGEAAAQAGVAEAYFRAAGDSLGPAHVQLARALGDARAKRLPEALAGFAAAAEKAEKVGGGRAAALAKVARADAAATLVMLGHGQDLARLAADAGLGDLVERQQAFAAAAAAYDGGVKAYAANDFAGARKAFGTAQEGFDALGETEYSLRARRSGGWAAYNALVLMPVAKAHPLWQTLVFEAAKLDEPELYARVYGAAVLAAVTQKVPDLRVRLTECVSLAQKARLPDVGARCLGALAEDPSLPLPDRARHAREAFALDLVGTAGPYALYAVAVDAYNAGDNALALELARLARPRAGTLLTSVDAVITAASP